MTRHRSFVRFSLGLVAALALAAPTHAKTLSEALSEAGFQDIALDIETCVTSHSPLTPVIAVKSFAAADSFGGENFSTAGKAIEQAMKDTIGQHTSLDIQELAEYTLEGEYAVKRIAGDNQQVTLAIDCRIVNRDGVNSAVIENELTIDDPQAIAEFTGVSLEFPQADDVAEGEAAAAETRPDAANEPAPVKENVDEAATEEVAAAEVDTDSNEEPAADAEVDDAATADAEAEDTAVEDTSETAVADAVQQAQSDALDDVLGSDNPQAAAVAGTIIRPAPDSPFAIEIRLLKKGASIFQPAAPSLVDGRTHVHVEEGDIYQVRLINDTQRDIAVELSIDGVNVFTFSDPAFKLPHTEFGTPVYSYYIVERGRVGTVSGWFKNLREVSQFEIAPEGQAAAGRVGLLDKIGTISATFRFAWGADEQPPADEPQLAAAGSRGLGTKEGRRQATETDEVRRFVGGPRATVSVRYSDQ